MRRTLAEKVWDHVVARDEGRDLLYMDLHPFALEEPPGGQLIDGLDDVALTFDHAGAIVTYEATRPRLLPGVTAACLTARLGSEGVEHRTLQAADRAQHTRACGRVTSNGLARFNCISQQ